MQRPLIVFASTLALFASSNINAQCGSASAETTRSSIHHEERVHGVDIVDTAIQAGRFKTLVAAVQAAGLESTLRSKGPFTVFAPCDDAFAKIPGATLKSLLLPENKTKLQDILKFHVVAGRMDAKAVAGAKTLTSVLGKPLAIDTSGSGVKIGGSDIVKTDIDTSNGIIHVIDTVMMPPATPDLVGLAVQAGSFGTLLKAAKAAGLVDALVGKGPFTVLAPTDAAFAKVDKAAIASLLMPENKAKLQAVLKAHIFAGSIQARGAVTAGSAKTISGYTVDFTIQDGQLMANGAKVIKTDLTATNGVIHAIDTVLLP